MVGGLWNSKWVSNRQSQQKSKCHQLFKPGLRDNRVCGDIIVHACGVVCEILPPARPQNIGHNNIFAIYFNSSCSDRGRLRRVRYGDFDLFSMTSIPQSHFHSCLWYFESGTRSGFKQSSSIFTQSIHPRSIRACLFITCLKLMHVSLHSDLQDSHTCFACQSFAANAIHLWNVFGRTDEEFLKPVLGQDVHF